ncbi:MAG: D-2-hydroxyacid dehydrogenase [Oscillospiraceae bacterium]|nr:D-2-hydroxyacid dehydrogenase [Oscillospiraceae bacterium]
MKIVILDAYSINPGDISWDELRKLGDTVIYDQTPGDLSLERIRDADIALVNKTEFTGELMDKCEKLKYIGELATGYNNIDLRAAMERGITVCNIPAYSTPSVVQHTFALLLELCMRTGLHSESVMAGKWSKCRDFCFWEVPLMELSGKTLGIIGYGQIGRSVAKTAVCFGMKVIACASRPRSESGIEGVTMADMDEILRTSDIVSLHCPLTKENSGLIRRETIAKMRDGVIIINTARGGLVNEQDTADALKSGKLGGFAADVLTQEPPKDGSPLFGCPNCIITPHIAWVPIESRKRLIKIATDNVRAFLDGHPQNKLN